MVIKRVSNPYNLSDLGEFILYVVQVTRVLGMLKWSWKEWCWLQGLIKQMKLVWRVD